MLALGGSFLLLAGSSLRAQDSAAAVPPPPPVPTAPQLGEEIVGEPTATDSARRYIKPMAAFWRSLLIPGWGQARVGRKLTAGVFVAWEGVTLSMALKANGELHYLERINDGRVDGKRQERQDWLVLLAVNHLFSAMEAYVSAHLWDFPGDLHIQAIPKGASASVNIPVRF
ncbi:MAG: hypothetical protein ABI765_05715 [Gemmatimonadota bacterium]